MRAHAVDELSRDRGAHRTADRIHRAHPGHAFREARGRNQVQHQLVAVHPRRCLAYADEQVDDHDYPQMFGEHE